MPWKNLSDFIPFKKFSDSKGLPIFHEFDPAEKDDFSEKENNPLDKDLQEIPPLEKKVGSDKIYEGSARNFMLKSKKDEGIILGNSETTNRWSLHPFIHPNNPNSYHYSSSGKNENGEWRFETRIERFSSGPQASEEFLGPNFSFSFDPRFFGEDRNSNFPRHDSRESDFFNRDPESDFFGPESDFFNHRNSDMFSFFRMGPGDIFQQMFDMMRNFHNFDDRFDPFSQPPRR